MDPFAIAGLLHGDLALTPGQLAQLRALNTKYFTELYALQHEGAEASAALDARIAADIRQMLSGEQRALLESSVSPTAETDVERPISAERETRNTIPHAPPDESQHGLPRADREDS